MFTICILCQQGFLPFCFNFLEMTIKYMPYVLPVGTQPKVQGIPLSSVTKSVLKCSSPRTSHLVYKEGSLKSGFAAVPLKTWDVMNLSGVL